jgi:DNA mismatch repair ATPase MutS
MDQIRTLHVDETTLGDLEVFRDSLGGGGLYALIDDTETPAGRKALKARLRAPPSDVAEIRRVQDAVRFLTTASGVPPLDALSIEAVEHYLSSNIQAVEDSGRLRTLADAVWLAVRYRDIYREMREGVEAARDLLRRADRAAGSILALGPPALLEELATELAAACETLSPSLVGGYAPATVRADRLLRETGQEVLVRVVSILGELDALRSMARATARLGWTFAEVVESEAFLLDGEGLRHPFVESPVPNPIRLSGSEPVIFLTGPNMAGKTTYLRTAALTVLLAQVGMGVPAARLRLTPVEVLLSSLNPSDDLRAGMSFFLVEVLRVRAAAKVLAEGRRSFVLFDEVFKGTNVRDALEASTSVISGFSRAGGSGFIFASHLVELGEALRSNPRIQLRHFDGQLAAGRAAFSYRVQPGLSDQRFGLQLLREAGVPELLAGIGR